MANVQYAENKGEPTNLFVFLNAKRARMMRTIEFKHYNTDLSGVPTWRNYHSLWVSYLPRYDVHVMDVSQGISGSFTNITRECISKDTDLLIVKHVFTIRSNRSWTNCC